LHVGTDDFPPTSFQISNIQSGTGALNVIPGFKKVHFNFRYSPATSEEKLKARVEEILKRHGLKFTLSWSEPCYPFLTPGGELVEESMQSVLETMKYGARSCTSGGTSDGRFVAEIYNNSQIVELGLINKSIHQVDEHVPVDDLERLSVIYERLLTRLLIAERDHIDENEYPDHVDVKPLP
jgi:succinyl-diaminopimelate desuccinylase